MRAFLIASFLCASLLFLPTRPAMAKAKKVSRRHVELVTSKGSIRLLLYPKKAPKTVKNFLAYVKSGHYDRTIFHRVIGNFMIQGGGFNESFEKKATRASVENEAFNGLKNRRGTVAMARTSDPHSASAQFFINVKDNGFLNFRGRTPRGWGYCVFAKVVSGMKVVDAIKRVRTGARGPFSQDAPLKNVVIKKACIDRCK